MPLRKHSQPEVERDKLLLCANFIDPTPQMLFPYMYCLGLNSTAEVTSDHARGCAIEHGYSYAELEVSASSQPLNNLDMCNREWRRSFEQRPYPFNKGYARCYCSFRQEPNAIP